jgi:hypothetical protein
MGNKRGRKRKSGERYPSGDLKPPVPPAAWGRIRDLGNPIFRTELGRLSFHRMLSDVQTHAGFYIGDIYRHFGGQENPRKTPAGRKSSEKIDRRLNSRQPLLFSAKDMRAEDWRTIENEVDALPKTLRTAVLDLCVFDRAINSRIYPELRDFLDRIARICAAHWARYQAPKMTFPKRRRRTEAAAKPSEDDADGAVVEEILSTLRPDLRGVRLEEYVLGVSRPRKFPKSEACQWKGVTA